MKKTMSCKMYLDKNYILAEVTDNLSDEIISWAYDFISDDDLYTENDYYVRVHNIHATVLSDIKLKNIKKIKDIVEAENYFDCKLGKIKIFTMNSKFDVLHVEITNDAIKKINQNLGNSIEHNPYYSIYLPHVTICYLKKGLGEKLLNNTYFEGKTFTVQDLIFSHQGKEHKFKLGKNK